MTAPMQDHTLLKRIQFISETAMNKGYQFTYEQTANTDMWGN